MKTSLPMSACAAFILLVAATGSPTAETTRYVLLTSDPTTNIADIRKVALVITQESVISPSVVYQALGIASFVQDAPSLRAVAAVAGTAEAGLSDGGPARTPGATASQHRH